jgi:PAS domain S-box-containing protein
MQIKQINRYVLAAVLAATVLIVASIMRFDHLRLQAEEGIERQRLASIETNRMVTGSDILTNSVRAFAATSDPKYEKAYWDEVKTNQTIEKAEAALRNIGLTNSETDLIERAKNNSDQLIGVETKAFKAGNAGNRTLALELVYGEDYRKALAGINGPIEQFRQRLDRRLTAEIESLRQRVQSWWYVIMALALFNTLLVIYILGVFYNRRLVEPLVRMNDAVKGMLEGRNTEASGINREHGVEEIAALAASFDVLRKTYQQADEQHWIKSHSAEIGAAMQQAEDFHMLTQNVVSKLAPLIGAGHGAFYVADTAGNYTLQASYGYRERKHLNNSFRHGEGLVGQCAMEKASIMLSAPKDYIRISSGLGEGPPACIIVLPIIHGERVLGVLEMASFQQFGERDKALLDALLPVLASSMEILDRNMKTRELLTATREQAERMEKQAAQLEEQSVEMEAQQAELLETENWFRSIIETAPDGMLVADAHGRILLANPACEAIFGYGAGDMLDGLIEQLVPASVRPSHAAKRMDFMAGNENRRLGENGRVKGLRKDGSEISLIISLAHLPPRGGRGKCVSVAVRRIDNQSV